MYKFTLFHARIDDKYSSTNEKKKNKEEGEEIETMSS